jgi:hypothetical protein
MIPSQLERLKQDHTDLEYYLQRLVKDDENDLKIPVIRKKQQFLFEIIRSLESPGTIRPAV